ncbi:glucose 1-dehydrogenase [Angustibacter sp. McL0619]|uniref:glucose 1-dehydrogenase n=1 Tax=Angustibacter sp. McL0619 TaxID=3415676 RepID=UPI003CEC4C63
MTDTRELFDLTGETALVTGSSRGIGAVLARGLAEAGASVLLTARDDARLQAAADELRDVARTPVHAVAFDVTDEADVARGLRELRELAGDPTILVNNAGVQHRQPITELAPADWQRVLDTNLTSAYLVAREVAPAMVRASRGKILNVCSVQTTLARPGLSAYAASKAGLAMLTQVMCAEWAASGVQANALAPGYVETELTAPLVGDPEFDAWIRGRTPAGRWGQPGDLVGAAVFLVSRASDFVNGQVLTVDGGLTAVV